MAPSGPRGLRGWLGAMFGHGGAGVPIIRPLVGDSKDQRHSQPGGVRMGQRPIRTPLCGASEVAGTPRSTVPTIRTARLVLKVQRTGL